MRVAAKFRKRFIRGAGSAIRCKPLRKVRCADNKAIYLSAEGAGTFASGCGWESYLGTVASAVSGSVVEVGA